MFKRDIIFTLIKEKIEGSKCDETGYVNRVRNSNKKKHCSLYIYTIEEDLVHHLKKVIFSKTADCLCTLPGTLSETKHHKIMTKF